MAYKFSVGTRVLSGNLVVSGNISASGGGPDHNGDITCADDFVFSSDAAVVNFGVDKDVTLTHVADTGLLLNSTRQLQFGDDGTYIFQSSDGVLDLVADTEIEINATTVDINGAIDASSTITAGGIIKTDDTTEATSTTDGSLQTDGGLSVAKSAVIGDDLDLLSNAAIFKVGSDQPWTLTHANASNTAVVTADHRLAFGDAGDYITGDGTDISVVSSADIILSAAGANVKPASDDQAALGVAGTAWSDLFLASGGVINFDSGDVTLTHTNDVLTIGGSSSPTLTATLTNALSKASNSGLAMTSFNGSAAVSDLAVDLDSLSAAAVDVAADSIAIIDANDSNGSRKESVSDFAAALVGGGSKVYGLDSTSGLIKMDISTLSTALTGSGIDGMDLLALDDVAGGSGQSKITVAGLAAKMAGAGLTAVNGVLRTDAGGTPNAIVNGEQLSEGWNYLTGTLAGAITLGLPQAPAPTVGDTYYFKAGPGVDGTRTVTIAASGAHKIDNESSIVLESPYGAISLVYMVSGSWSIF